MTKDAKQPWMSKVPADMTLDELQEARDWFNQRSTALLDRGRRFAEASVALNRALTERLNIPYDGNEQAPPYPDFSGEDIQSPV